MSEILQEIPLRVRLDSTARPEGGFEIMAISAGEGNGWVFEPDVLRASLPLWDNAPCFVDHAWQSRSVRDLAGVCSDPEWDEARRGIRLQLSPFGPAAETLETLGRQMLSAQGALPPVGFSADLILSADGAVSRQVRRILRVVSVDLVFEPARGGAFLRPLAAAVGGETFSPANFAQKELSMTEPALPLSVSQPEPAPAHADLCAALLTSSLAAAHLPLPVENRLRARFAGREFEAADLSAALEDARSLVGDLTAGQIIQSARGGAVEAMFDERDQITAAIHDLLGAQRPHELESARVHRLSGIRELYTLMTGDTGFSGGYDPQRARFAVSADLPGVLKNTLNKLIAAEWDQLGRSGYRWWESIVSVEHFNSLQPITGVLVGEVNVLPTVNEGAAYIELPVSDSAETGSWQKYGGYIGLTLEMFERDETHRLRQYPRKLANASLRRISRLVADIFTVNSGTGPQMTDTYKVFEAAHHANLGTSALNAATWDAACRAIYDQPLLVASGGNAPRLALDARYLLVPRALRLTAMQILYPSMERSASIFSENMQRGEWGDVITCPEFTDASDWAAVADPRLAPAIIIGERFGLQPEIFIADNATSGALFTNDEIRMKVRHWVSVFVADYRPLYKANVA